VLAGPKHRHPAVFPAERGPLRLVQSSAGHVLSMMRAPLRRVIFGKVLVEAGFVVPTVDTEGMVGHGSRIRVKFVTQECKLGPILRPSSWLEALSMRRTILASALISFLGVHVSPACAWWDAGHMQIAYVAYKHLDAPVKDKVDALLKLNADYSKWTAGAPDEKTAKLYAFVHAATGADDIKRKEYGYTRDNVNSATAGQNIGYSDHNQHAYWHFKDINFSPDGTPLPMPDPVDLLPVSRVGS
jgi:hypothetical protein